ncbi:MAG: phosphotransferase [Actinomycetota bacterium]
MDRIHDHEVDTSESVVRSLLAEYGSAWHDLPMHRLDSTGTTNALWRIATGVDKPDAVVRLPRQPSSASSTQMEHRLLPRLSSTALGAMVATPNLIHAGEPCDRFPLPWTITEWISGSDVWSERMTAAGDHRLAESLAVAVQTIRSLTDMPVSARTHGQRGGPFAGVVFRLQGWLDDPTWQAKDLLDVAAVRRIVDQANEVGAEHDGAVFAHGDLLPGNLLVNARGRLSAIIDWGGAGLGDPAEDLVPAWSIFDATSRRHFRAAMEVDDATWTRARTTALEQAVGGVLYYRPKRHPLGDVMAETLDRILTDG